MKSPAFLTRLLTVLLCGISPAVLFSFSEAGDLNPPGPLSASATGYTLNDIYERLTSGTAGPGYYALFPAEYPGPTGVTLARIYDALPGGTTTNAAAGDVRNGKTFILRANGCMAFSSGTGEGVGGHELPASGQAVSYADYDDPYNEQQSVGFSSAARVMGYTLYNYYGGSLHETMDVGKSSVTVDNRTGLVWMTDGNFWGSSTTWANAITRCQNLNTGVYAGYTDWRLPNVRELMTIIQCGAYGPAIDSANFRNTQNLYYWSSTTHATTATSAWCVYFLRGSVNYFGKTSYYYVRAVRGGP